MTLPCYSQEQQDIRENCELLKLILARPHKEGRYIVVEPKTGFNRKSLRTKEDIDRTKAYVKKNLIIPDYDISALLDVLFEINQKSIPIEIDSNIEQGYFIDKEDRFGTYFKKDGGGWEKLHKENPKVGGITTVSIPAYDRVNNIILLYMGTQIDYLAGRGGITACRVEDNKLIVLNGVILWKS